jgi:large subunit ribosomal protein L9
MVKVLLTQLVERLGEPGDIVDVAPGYARNFLFPKGLAVEPTPHNIERFKKVRLSRLAEIKEREEQAKALREKLEGYVLPFYRKVHDDEKLYSSVRPEEIATRLSEELDVEIEKGRVQLEGPIERLGRHTVKVNLYKDITAEIQVEVLKEPEALPDS